MSDAPESSAPEAERSSAILIVDDEALLRLVLSDFLQDQGFKVLEACNGDEALAIMAAPGFAVDLVFTDVMMPGLTDGFGLANWIVKNQPHVAVIVTSGDAEKMVAAENLSQSIQFVPKPYDLAALTVQIRHTLNQKSSAS